MDKKNTILGVLLLVAAGISFYLSARMAPPSPAPRAPEVTRAAGANRAGDVSTSTTPADAAFASVATTVADAKVVVLSNDFIEARFTDFGAAIDEVALRGYEAELAKTGAPYLINQLHAEPALAFVDFPGLDRRARYELVSQTAAEVVFRTVWEKRVEVLRRYSIVPGSGDEKNDPYVIRYETTLRNLTDESVVLPRAQLSVGTAAPLNEADPGLYLATGYHDGADTEIVKRSKLEGGGILSYIGFGSRTPIPYIETIAPITWASAENQFFVSILTPDQPGVGLVTRRVELPPFPNSVRPAVGMTSTARFDLPALAPKGETKLAGSLYAGPKEYHRLSNAEIFKNDQDAVMQFGFFSFFSKILLTLMTWVHQHLVASWGWAIVITTLILKFVFLPLTLSASKSAKRMQKIQPEMAALKEKFKDNPQKMQQATMELFKKHRVNPVGGCLPILITIPFFIGFFSMLQSTAELRFQAFLWAKDLSAPDTVARLWGLPINIMPILMGATMIIQMRLTPQPTVDNAQAKMFKFMPYFFALICYNFSCALSLYSTINGLFTIVQQIIINRMKDPEPVATVATGGGRRGMKNVTPKK